MVAGVTAALKLHYQVAAVIIMSVIILHLAKAHAAIKVQTAAVPAARPVVVRLVEPKVNIDTLPAP